ncbi:methyltransferase domain protein [Necator americanus]|uniref:Arsenite methyltransferase n=1 Tax=Necator americanus TaxID=51031 RepID=W2TAA4_NECAM|nr:methyltransferase domain protein [Necator americanus]ETN78965.1 methyltransferase domain protein [Necator americanus]
MTSKHLSLKEACEQFESLINRVKQREQFIDWIHNTYCEGEDSAKPLFVTEAIDKLREIADHIRIRVPDGTVKSEKINWPTSGHDADCEERNTVHVDCFLYDDHALEGMMKTGKLQRRYCVDCGSKNIKDLNFISHSMAHCQLEFMFTQLVPLRSQVEGFRVLDIGSRLGAVIFAASLYGCGRVTVTGVEINEEFIKLQEDVIRKFSLQNIEVVHADIRNKEDLVSQADMIIMNNVFSFFMNADEQASCFEFIHKYAKKGCFIIHNPEIETVFAHLKLPFTTKEWLQRISTEDDCDMFANGDKDVLSDCKMLGFYRVR